MSAKSRDGIKTLRINLQGDDDEEGTTYPSSLWMHPRVDGFEFNKNRTDSSHWMKPNWTVERVFSTYRSSSPVNDSSSTDDEDSKSDATAAPPTLQIPWPRTLQQRRTVNFNMFGTMLKAASKFRKALPIKEESQRLTFPGEPVQRKSSTGTLADLNNTKNFKGLPSNEQDDDKLDNVGDIVPRKISQDQIDAIVSRVSRPTNSSRARSACARRVYFPEPKPPEPSVRINYLLFAPKRFRGLKKVSSVELEEITERLSKFDIERWPPNSMRSLKHPPRPSVIKSHSFVGLRNY